ncbi:MAG: RNA polymerase sigma factor [Acetivibrionales bacterium]|jgi:RNA polymerase sigma-70 factor (ECF subfamily)
MFKTNKSVEAQKGDLKSIEEICSITWKPLYRFIYFKVQNQEETEDIIQETYAKALSHVNETDINSDKFAGFLKTIALNVLRDKWRKNKRQGKKASLDRMSLEDTTFGDFAENSVQRILIENALNKLNEEQRKVVELRVIKGYSVAEVAKIVNKKETNIRVLQYRALQTLANILKNNG